jgi:hypothetical protein
MDARSAEKLAQKIFEEQPELQRKWSKVQAFTDDGKNYYVKGRRMEPHTWERLDERGNTPNR